MSVSVSLVLDDKITRYFKAQETDKSLSELITDFLNEWYEVKLHKLHQQYLAGDLTLRGMARQLNLDYYELYDLMEARELTV